MGQKILEWLRALTLGVLIVLGCLHFKTILLSAMTLDLTKLTVTQLISYEWIVPLISFSALMGRRREIAIAAKLPTWTGLGLTAFFLVTLSFSAQSGKTPFQLLSIAGLIYSVGYAFWGRAVSDLLRFPMSFLIFAVPVSFYLTGLEKLSPALSEWLIRAGASSKLFGFTYLRDLFNIKGFILEPASTDSGLHSLIAMIAITVALAHFTVKTRLQRWALYVCGIPITLLTNLFRSLFICLIAILFDRAWAVTFFKQFSNYGVFFLGLLLVFFFANLIIKVSDRFKKPTAKIWMQSLQDHETPLDMPEQSLLKSMTIVLLVLVFASAAFFFTNITKLSEDDPKTTPPVPALSSKP